LAGKQWVSLNTLIWGCR